jgi:cell wall-associated NlpC family hydrolase
VLRTLFLGAVSLIVLAPATVAHADPTLAEIEAQLDKSGDELEATVEAYNAINIDLAATQAKLQPLSDSMAAANANVEQVAIEAFKSSSNLRGLSVVLNATSSNTLMDQLSTLQQITKQQQKQITEYNQAKLKLDETLAAQNAQKADLENKKKKIEGDVKKLDDLKKKAENAGSTMTKTVAKPTGPPPAVSGKAGQAVTYAWNQIGKPYKWGASGPNSFDCSGLTMMAWKAAGVTLEHNAARQWNQVAHISRSQLAPGDLVFYSSLGHVGIYIGNNQIIHAPTTGKNVQIAPVDKGSSIYGFGRVRA